MPKATVMRITAADLYFKRRGRKVVNVVFVNLYLCTSHSRTHINCVLYIFVHSSCEYVMVLVVCLILPLTATFCD